MYGWAVVLIALLGRDVEDEVPGRPDADASKAGKLRVECGIACVDAQGRRVEFVQLVGGRDHVDAIEPDAAEDGGTELLVPAPEEVALAADDAQHEPRTDVREEREERSLREVA